LRLRLLVVGLSLMLAALEAHAAAAKPLLRGLVYMGDIGFHRSDEGIPNNALDTVLSEPPGTFSAVVINLTWRQLQPAEGALDTAALDAALNRLRDYNREHPETPLRATVRVWPGPNAPDWAKRLDGPPVHINHVAGRDILPLTIGRVWASRYRAAWRRLQQKLAARYDGLPIVAEVSAASCSTITDEAILLPDDAASVAALHAAGYSDAAFRTCLMQSPADYAAWRETPVDVFINPYRGFDSGRPQLDLGVDEDYMRAWRKAFGRRSILANAGLQGDPPPFLAKLLTAISHAGAPILFQMYSPEPDYYPRAVALGAALGASEIELWGRVGARAQGFTAFEAQDLRGWRAVLRDTPDGSAPQ
jgi:hypothetical protein